MEGSFLKIIVCAKLFFLLVPNIHHLCWSEQWSYKFCLCRCAWNDKLVLFMQKILHVLFFVCFYKHKQVFGYLCGHLGAIISCGGILHYIIWWQTHIYTHTLTHIHMYIYIHKANYNYILNHRPVYPPETEYIQKDSHVIRFTEELTK